MAKPITATYSIALNGRVVMNDIIIYFISLSKP